MLNRSPTPPFVKGAAQAPQGRGSQPQAAAPIQGLHVAQVGGNVTSTLDISLQRLEEIIEQETAALRGRGPVDLKSFNDRKSQALLDLSRLLRHAKGAAPNPALEKRIGQIQSKLALNQAVLKIHLEAVREISTRLSDAIQEADSDGTYTPAIYGVGRRQ